jgi:GMP synthase-like glutamine amidotransferase
MSRPSASARAPSPEGLILSHGADGPAGLLGEWLEERGVGFVVRDVSRDGVPQLGSSAFLASLGAVQSAAAEDPPWVAEEVELIREAVEEDVPVLGLCFGGQALAAVLGGRVEPAPVPEFGWHEIETDVPELVPAGPWLVWHYERFATPPGARELARTAHAVHAFRLGPHLGVQFHPESTTDIVAGWARKDAARLAGLGIDDGEALLTAPPERHRAARDAAFRLFDAFALMRERV